MLIRNEANCNKCGKKLPWGASNYNTFACECCGKMYGALCDECEPKETARCTCGGRIKSQHELLARKLGVDPNVLRY